MKYNLDANEIILESIKVIKWEHGNRDCTRMM